MKSKHLLFSTTSALLVGLMPIAAHAAEGIYLELGGGAVSLMDSDISGSGIDTDADFDAGYGVRAALGHAYGGGWRAEVELGYRANEVDTVDSSSGSGDANALSGMINGYKDFDLGNGWMPYIGLGAGVVRVEADGYSPVSTSSIDDEDTVFGYQGIAGVAWSLSDSLALTADYRYLATDDLALTTAGGSNVDAEYRSHSVMVGLRFSFGANMADASAMAIEQPTQAMVTENGQGSGDGVIDVAEEATDEEALSTEAAAEAASEPASMAEDANETETTEVAAADPLPDFARAYRVLFALDSAVLSGAAQGALREITGHVLRGEIISIEATGHADASGTASHNMTLSKHRAEAVRDTLIDMGVDGDMIAITWRGEEELLVQTADGVTEQRNRRVEIVIPE